MQKCTAAHICPYGYALAIGNVRCVTTFTLALDNSLCLARRHHMSTYFIIIQRCLIRLIMCITLKRCRVTCAQISSCTFYRQQSEKQLIVSYLWAAFLRFVLRRASGRVRARARAKEQKPYAQPCETSRLETTL